MNQTIKADLTEIVFAHRERNYGAYVLRKRYPKVLLLATLLTVLGTLSIPATNLLLNKLGWKKQEIEQNEPDKPEQISPPSLFPKEELLPPPPPPPKLTPPKVKVVSARIPVPTPDSTLEEDEPLHEQELLRAAPLLGISDQEGEEDSLYIEEAFTSGQGIPQVLQEPGIPDPHSLVIPDEHPRVLNMSDVSQAIGYPQAAQSIGLEGQVVIRVLIDQKGAYQKHIVLNGVHPILEKAVEAQLHKLRFTPAIQGKKPIPFWVNIPFAFKLIK